MSASAAKSHYPNVSMSLAGSAVSSQRPNVTTSLTVTAPHGQRPNVTTSLTVTALHGQRPDVSVGSLLSSQLPHLRLGTVTYVEHPNVTTGSDLSSRQANVSEDLAIWPLWSHTPNVSVGVAASELSSQRPYLSTEWARSSQHPNVSVGEGGGGWGEVLGSLVWLPCCRQVALFVLMVTACSLLGTLGNIPVLLVYRRTHHRHASTTFIQALALIDLLVCALVMPYTIVMELHLVTSDVVCRLFEFLRHVSVTASNLTLVAIAVERYVAVCRIRHRLTVRHVRQGMGAVLGASLVVALPSVGFFTLSRQEEVAAVPCAFPHRFPRSFAFCHFNPSLLGPALGLAYQTALMLLFFLSVIVIVVFYSVVHSFLWKRANRRPSSQSLKSDMDISSCGERRRLGHASGAVSDASPQEHLPAGTAECCSEDHVIRLAELNAWPLSGEDSPSTAESVQGGGRGVQRRVSMHRRTARMLFLCTVVFLVTWLPFWVDVFSLTHNLCLRYMFFLGNATNPVVYGIANSHFRRSFIRLVLRLKGRCTLSKHS